MNKKGKMGFGLIVSLIILLALLAVVLGYVIWGPDAILQKLASWSDSLADNILGPLRKEAIKKSQTEIDKYIESMYENIVSVLRTEGNGPCLLTYKPLASNFKDYKIILSKTDSGIFIELMDKKGRSVKRNTITGKFPCVVGEGQAAINFNKNYLGSKLCESNCLNDYSIANIEINDKSTIYVNGKKRNLKDNSLIFRTMDGNTCFFPTYKTGVSILKPWEIATKYGCDAGEYGLDDDCIDNIKTKIPSCQKSDEWPIILQEYEKNKCKVDKYTCKVENFPCQCFTSTQKENKLKPDVCSIQKPYCYDGVEGCSDKGPDIGYYFFVCRETNKNFQLAPKCSVDIDTCKVKNAPCTCYITKPVAGQESFPQLCLEGQYCYNEQKGCSTEASLLDCQKSNKN